VKIDIPKAWAGQGPVILNFDPECEAMVWSTKGEPLQGITGGDGGDRHVDFPLLDNAAGGEHFEFYIEVACNGMFGNATDYGIAPPNPNRTFTLKTSEIAIPNMDAHHLWWDFEIIVGMCKELPADSQGSNDALYTANTMVNTIRAGDESSLLKAREISAAFFKSRSDYGTPDHEITATGHCHIDTAWLWPYDETKRKAARSWSTQQAQQFEWLEQLYPPLFERVKEKVKSGNFVPIGGTWVEMDCNMPSGEALCRQFLYGQRYFESRFGKRCKVFWLPDTFGYAAQLPQIVKESGLKYFFTQKLSWNNINKFPNTTFNWVGLDGSAVLTHFSPADTYNAQCNPREIIFSVKNNKDKPYSNKSLLLFGNGDGGGGALAPMIERLRRMQKVVGLPATVKFGEPTEFYDELASTSRDLVSWKGELYFELHRGTYTSHAKTKKGNRKSEFLMRMVELFSALACATSKAKFEYPKKEIDRLWKLLLLNQFHDVLPGSSIEMVYDDALKFYADIEHSATKLIDTARSALMNSFVTKASTKKAVTVFNPTSWSRSYDVVELDLAAWKNAGMEALGSGEIIQKSACGTKVLVLVDEVGPMSAKTFSMGYKPASFVPITVTVTNIDEVLIDDDCDNDDEYVKVRKTEEQRSVVENKFIRATFDGHGRLVSLVDKVNGDREAIAPNSFANVFKIFEDIPLFWDAWDVEVYHLEKGWDAGVGNLTVEEEGPLRVVLKAEHPITDSSSLVQRIVIGAMSPVVEFDTVVEWNENRKILKVEFPVNINCDYATYETQFGFIQRPTHYNNSWDLARFEVCGHKFVDFSEYGYGVALLNDCKYGHAVHGNVMRISLLRSPKAPDGHCDIGQQSFKYAIYPHKGSFYESDVVREGYQFNQPLIAQPGVADPASPLTDKQYFFVDAPNVVLDTVKVAEDPTPGAPCELVLRFYEAYGGRGPVRLTSELNIKEAHFCNILEDKGEAVPRDPATGALMFDIAPFKIVSLRLVLG
ncbi:Glycoside hydrolase, 38 vacuolar alpha mannosidase, partial [Quaeritorhiza haematococci]